MLIKKNRNAFSLLELSLVISISSFLVMTSVATYSKLSKYTALSNSTQKVENAKLSIERYFAQHGHLPCPADPTLSSSDPNYGIERLDITGTGCSGKRFTTAANKPTPLQFGSLPTRSMGIPDNDMFDSFGNKITYVIADSLANYGRHSDSIYKNLYGYTTLWLKASGDITNNMFGQSSSCSMQNFTGLFGNINGIKHDAYRTVMNTCNAQIVNNVNNQIIQSAKDNLAFVLIGHGKNGFGAWNIYGTLNALSPNINEQKNSYAYYVNNATGFYTTNYVFDNTGVLSKPLKFYEGSKSETFDDDVVWHTISGLLSASKTSISMYCHPSTHPGFLTLYPTGNILSRDKDLALTLSGKTLNVNRTIKTCSGNGIWM
jgi:type II secretory pathway pseudopilin PulG